jgi:DNA-binding MarR family transcriptional regulator
MIQMSPKVSRDVMKLSKSELKLLNLLSRRGEMDLGEIISSLGLTPARISQLVSSLRKSDFIKDTRHGMGKAIALSGSKHALLFAEVSNEFEHIDFPQILSGSNLEVLSAVSYLHLRSRTEIRDRCLVSEASVARSLSKLRQRGVVQRNSIYAVNGRFSRLREFIMEYRRYLNSRIASGLSERAHIVW